MRYVYLIRGNDGRYKIGIAKNPSQRIKQLQTGNSDKLEIIESYQSENASKIETTLHNRYAYARQEGEWFDLSLAEEADFMDRCKQIDNSILALQSMGNPFL